MSEELSQEVKVLLDRISVTDLEKILGEPGPIETLPPGNPSVADVVRRIAASHRVAPEILAVVFEKVDLQKDREPLQKYIDDRKTKGTGASR